MVIFTLASCCNALEHKQYLVSVAKVTRCFGSMNEYAHYVLKQKREKLLWEKLSRLPRGKRGLGWRFGDCHADRKGEVKEPGEGHVHAGCKARGDLKPGHLIVVSDCFVTWHRPKLWANRTIHQSRFGIDVTPDNLNELLVSQ